MVAILNIGMATTITEFTTIAQQLEVAIAT